MRSFTILLMLVVTVVVANGGYRLITGRELVDVNGVVRAVTDLVPTTAAAPEPTAAPTKAPTKEPTAAPPPTSQPKAAQQFEPYWVQNHTETDLWSGPDGGAVSFGKIPQWSYFKVVAPQEGQRLYVFNPVTQNYAYIDASAVGRSAAPPEPTATPQAKPTTMVVGNTDGMGVYVRRSPSMADKIRAWPDRTPMVVLQQGIEGDGQKWMKVRSPDGKEGYIPEEYLVAP